MTELTVGRVNFGPLNRALIGFDQLFNTLEFRTTTNYPPYNVIKNDENSYVIEVAVSGFKKKEISVQIDGEQLFVKGTKQKEETKPQYLHQGLSTRNFTHQFTIAEYIEVKSAVIDTGVLKIVLERKLPEHKKPRELIIDEV